MRRMFFSCPILCLSAVAFCAQYASADPPQTLLVEYWIHETPTDPNSDITFKIRMWLASEEVDGDQVGWDVTTIEVRQMGDNGGPDTVWTDTTPTVPTPDGLWWVEHADPDNPEAGEFVMPPGLTGTADADDPNDDDLVYDFEGVTYTPPQDPSEPPYDTTGALDYGFTLNGDEDPLASGEDKPVELPPVENDPPGAS